MAEIKGSGVIFLKNMFKDKGREAEEKFLSKLTPSESNVYAVSLAFDWYPIDTVTSLYEKAAPLLFPGHPEAMKEIGRASAHHDLRGMYKVFVRMSTIPFVLSQATTLWQKYHKKGELSVQKDERTNVISLVLKNYPEIPKTFHTILCGYYEYILGLTGARNIRVVSDARDLMSLRWTVTWN